MKLNTLTNALPIVAAAYGRKFGVNVQVGGSRASTDGQTINIPGMVEDSIFKTLAWGYLAHEAAHVRYTDFEVWREMVEKESPLTRIIGNILEDVRIENAMLAPYPGTRGTLDAVMAWLVAQGEVAAPSETDSPAEALGNGLLVIARNRYRKQSVLANQAKEAERVMRKVFPPRLVHRLLGLLAEIPEMKGTADAAILARRIVALIQEEAQDPPRPESNPSSPPGSDENAGEQDGDQRDSGEREPGEGARDGSGQEGAGNESGDRAEQGAPCDGNRTGESQGQAQSEEGDDGSQGTGQGDNDSEASPGGHGAGGEGGEGRNALQAVLSAGESDLPRDVFGTVAEALSARSHGRSSVLLPTLEPYQGQPARGRAALSLVKAESAKLTARLWGLVQSHTMAQVRVARRGRALSPAHLHRLAVGDARVFQRTEQKAAPNTVLHLLVDLSGSMCGGQDRIALDAAMAVALALEPMRGVSCAVTAFPSLRGAADSVTRILSHGDRIAARAGAFVQNARGSTPMTGALWYAAADLLARSEERKVILTLTDGEPDDRSSARTMVDRASAAGLELIGVGIGIHVDHLFPVSVRIDGIADLKNELFRIAEQLLLK